MANVVECTNGIAADERLRGKPGDDRLPIRVGGLKAVASDDVRVRGFAIGQQQTTLVEKLRPQRSQHSRMSANVGAP